MFWVYMCFKSDWEEITQRRRYCWAIYKGNKDTNVFTSSSYYQNVWIFWWWKKYIYYTIVINGRAVISST